VAGIGLAPAVDALAVRERRRASPPAWRRRAKAQGNTTKVLAFGGDGGTFDIGFQALSGMLERGHNVLYVCYDNEAYMNTGIQRSSSTPHAAMTTTSPPARRAWASAI
jgi:pyruvate/2-oxoacid:ferredoxin oxidoreductase beta subunit